MSYSVIQPPFTLDFSRMSKRELADYREWFLDVLQELICILEEAVRITTGYEHWRADETPESLGVLGEWLATHEQLKRHIPGNIYARTSG